MTFDDIARDLGVSKSTVSRALSGKGRIGAETRLRIQAYAKERGVLAEKPSDIARNLAVIIPTDVYTVNIPFFQESLMGISEVAAMLNYSVQIISGTIASDISTIQKLVESKKVDGIIFLRSVVEDRLLKYLDSIHFPTGLIGSCAYENVIQVDADSREASKTLTSLLIRQGYRKFAMLVGNTTYYVNQDRCEGFFDALELKGLDRKSQLFYPNFVNIELVDNIINDIFAKKVECIVCGDDVICSRIMSGLQSEGYRIPKDISIVSLYNSMYLEYLSPAVTAVNISARRMGNIIGKQLINCLQGEDYQVKTKLDYEILGRKSTGKLYQA